MMAGSARSWAALDVAPAEAMLPKIAGVAFMALFVAGIVAYVVYSYWKMTKRGMAAHFGLEKGETITQLWVGEFEDMQSTLEKVLLGGAGVVLGGLFGVLPVGAVQDQIAPKGVTAMLTGRGRFVLALEKQDGQVNRVYFASPAEVSVRHVGPSKQRVQGSKGELFAVMGQDGAVFHIVLHPTAVALLAPWAPRSA